MKLVTGSDNKIFQDSTELECIQAIAESLTQIRDLMKNNGKDLDKNMKDLIAEFVDNNRLLTPISEHYANLP